MGQPTPSPVTATPPPKPRSASPRPHVALTRTVSASVAQISAPPALCRIAGVDQADIPADSCAAIQAKIHQSACFAWMPHEDMTIQHATEVRAALSKAGDCQTAGQMAGNGGANAPASTVQMAYATRVYATLTGDTTLNIKAISPEEVDTHSDPTALWRWQVTPTARPDHGQQLRMELHTGVIVQMPDGTSQRFGNQPKPLLVTVKVSPEWWRQVFVGTFEDWTKALGAVLGALAALVISVKKLREAVASLWQRG